VTNKGRNAAMIKLLMPHTYTYSKYTGRLSGNRITLREWWYQSN